MVKIFHKKEKKITVRITVLHFYVTVSFNVTHGFVHRLYNLSEPYPVKLVSS